MASKWATSHRGKPLWEIQIEVLEWLVSKKKESDTDIYDQAELVGPLLYLADHLRRTKTAVPPYKPFYRVPGSDLKPPPKYKRNSPVIIRPS